MQNDFEKQVQQKMEELDLVPSAPVWEKIELQIRQKKDQRRFVLWFFLLALLAGGGTLWLIDQSGDARSVAKTEKTEQSIENKNSKTLTSNPETSPSIIDQSVTGDENPSSKQKQNNFHTEEIEKSSASKVIENNRPGEENNVVVKNSTNKERKINKTSIQESPDVSDIPSKSISVENKKSKPNKQKNKIVVAPAVDDILSKETKVPSETKSVQPNNSSQEKNKQPVNKIADTAEAKADTLKAVVYTDPVNKNEVITENNLPAVDSVSKVNTVIAALPPKWQFGFSAGIGVSGLGEGISFSEAGSEKSLRDAFQASPASYSRVPYSRGYTPPSVVKKNVAYSISAVVRRLIGKKIQISSGVGYDYYSTLLENGKMDSVNMRFGTSSGSSYSFTAGSAFSNYNNKFHFITVPLNIHFRVFKKTPLNLFGGVAVKHMVATNAMEYNHLTYLYSSDINAYNRTQVFSSFGFEYDMLNKKNQLLVGPEITYGISKHLSTGSPQHLYSIGIKAEFLFQKN